MGKGTSFNNILFGKMAWETGWGWGHNMQMSIVKPEIRGFLSCTHSTHQNHLFLKLIQFCVFGGSGRREQGHRSGREVSRKGVNPIHTAAASNCFWENKMGLAKLLSEGFSINI